MSCSSGLSRQHFGLVEPPRLSRARADRAESLRTDPERLADDEIAEAFWVTREELRAELTDGDRKAHDGRLLLPPAVSIARSMLDSWAAAG